jgi:hypothetical protein
MPDNLKNSGPPDPSRINLAQDHEVVYWTQRFQVHEDELRYAVKAVGTSVYEVAKWFRLKNIIREGENRS